MKKLILIIGMLALLIISGCNSKESYKSILNGTIIFTNMTMTTKISRPPIEQFCNEMNKEVYIKRNFLNGYWGCLDNQTKEITLYSYYYNDNYWYIGNKSYKAEWG